MVRCLLEAGADKDKSHADGATPLHAAASTGEDEVVRCLLAKGADCTKVTKRGATALDVAIREGSMRSIDLLRSYAK